MISLTDIAQQLQTTASQCWTASHGSNTPTMRKTLTDTVTELDTIASHLHRAREIGPDDDLELAMLASRVVQRWSRGHVADARDDWLRVWAYMKRAEQEEAA